MQTAVLEKQNNGTSRAVTALRRIVTVLALTGWLAVALLGGRSLSPITIVVFGLCCMMYLILPGLALADWLAPRQKGLTGLFAAVYGCALLAGLHCISVRLGAVWLLVRLILVCCGHSGPLAALAALMIFLCGLLLTGMGVLGGYITRSYDEVKGRPLYIVAERHGFEENEQFDKT